ncbi:GLOBIN domain-containing protein [Mycena indigotica]|uniref:GLOBIN domain-containing protein n=1 Tax=Mycena indigotica TaxID=2126181 RepID=A0A8H6VWX7_9AGAR|nr:GLOBIN domain-containing protein [Mycena indigotica]KAF7291204.1 GLOBIN domain-containing protein [Mycena indigotica]
MVPVLERERCAAHGVVPPYTQHELCRRGLDELVNDVILSPDFEKADFEGFSARKELERLDKAADILPGEPPSGWHEGSVKIRLPSRQPDFNGPEEDAPKFTVGGIMYRPLLEVLEEVVKGPLFEHFHTTPFAQRWDREHDPRDPDFDMPPVDAPVDNSGIPPPSNSPRDAVQRETVVAAFMLFSDSTHLANFGMASLWPLYVFFGNHSKYFRCTPTGNFGFHAAYFPSLPDDIHDFFSTTFNGEKLRPEVVTHLKRELMHAVWAMLLDGKFLDAYENGIRIVCLDGIERLFFPRFFTYGADYPEKVLLATIRNLGGCPCPKCLIKLTEIPNVGTKADLKRRANKRVDTERWRDTIEMVRRWIFENGRLVAGKAVNTVLQPFSWIPTRNAFSKLVPFGLNLFDMFVPDLLHEVELGTIKQTFTHTVRLLNACTDDGIQQFDERFRQVPSFPGTIRPIHTNPSDMKKLAARDFEDMGQCILPVIEGLIPEHNELLQDIWFDLMLYHGLAKLRLHNDSTLAELDRVYKALGANLRRFERETSGADTRELAKEFRGRIRRATEAVRRQREADGQREEEEIILDSETTTHKVIMGHLYGDLGRLIHTQPRRLSFRTVLLSVYMDLQIVAALSARLLFGNTDCEVLRRMRQRMNPSSSTSTKPVSSMSLPTTTASSRHRFQPIDDDLTKTPPRHHHHISESQRTFITTHELVNDPDFTGDPALKVTSYKNLLFVNLLGDDSGKGGDELPLNDKEALELAELDRV